VGCMDLVDLAQNRARWLAVIDAVMNLRVIHVYSAGNFFTS
jgi:hypothetical protein